MWFKAVSTPAKLPQTAGSIVILSKLPVLLVEMNRSGPWTDSKTKVFISIWGEVNIQEQLDGATRNKTVFVDISKQLQRLGYDKDWQQCRIKVKNLKNQYKKVKDHNGVTGNRRKVFKYYEQLDRILGHRPASLPTVLVDTASDDTDMRLEENDILSTQEDVTSTSLLWIQNKVLVVWPLYHLLILQKIQFQLTNTIISEKENGKLYT